jgi:hypothetical protein
MRQIIVCSTDINPSVLQVKLKNNNYDALENWLNEQNGSVMTQVYHTSSYFVAFFNKKRPSMVPNYIIPSEYEMLELLSKNKVLQSLGI